jgi:tryptophan synthase alpha chain
MSELLRRLREQASAGRKLLVPYLVGGIPDAATFPGALEAIAQDADAVEVGLPYSDPLMDGPVIAAAAERAIRAGTGPLDALDLAGRAKAGIPLLAMTYYNPVHRAGEEDFCRRAAKAGISGLIVPDLPLEESASLRAAAEGEGLAWVPLVAPSSPPERVASIAGTATGFVYAASTLGVTGTRAELSERAAAVVESCRAVTDLPVLVGIGVSNADQARAACDYADGVVIGSAVVAALVEQGVEAAGEFLAGIRRALDSA